MFSSLFSERNLSSCYQSSHPNVQFCWQILENFKKFLAHANLLLSRIFFEVRSLSLSQYTLPGSILCPTETEVVFFQVWRWWRSYIPLQIWCFNAGTWVPWQGYVSITSKLMDSSRFAFATISPMIAIFIKTSQNCKRCLLSLISAEFGLASLFPS